MVRRTALITGASSGIGLELATVFAKNKFDVILVARSEKKLKNISQGLEKLYSIKSYYISKDLNKKRACEDVYEFVRKKKINLTALVNNAGFGSYGDFKDLDLKHELDMINLNISVLVELTHLFCKDLVKSKGYVLNVASVAAFQPIPNMATYAATKSFVFSFSNALNEELSESEVSVTALCPGATKTNFDKRAGMRGRSKVFDSSQVMSAERVAQEGFEGMLKRKEIVVPGGQNKAISLFTRALPTKITAKLAKAVMK